MKNHSNFKFPLSRVSKNNQIGELSVDAYVLIALHTAGDVPESNVLKVSDVGLTDLENFWILQKHF